MNTHSLSNQPIRPAPPDDLARDLKITDPDLYSSPHLAIAGGTYTVLLSGNDTDGRYCLIDMHVPPGAGPPPHRHDFEETFSILAGQIELTFRGKKHIASAGQTVHIPANAPHYFKNASSQPARLLCITSPAGQEDLFAQLGVQVSGRTVAAPPPDDAARAATMKKAAELAPRYRTEFLEQ